MTDGGGKTPGLAGARVMFYCHDTYGLGHLRRTLTVANYLQRSAPGISQLIVTGSPVAHRFQFPEGADYVKLPSITKTRNGDYTSQSLSSGFDDLRNMREEILLSAAQHFRPDLFIVDHAPGGLKGEAVKSLHHIRTALPETRLVVGLRDILDEPSTVRRSWARDGIYELLDEVYDLILVYGHRHFYDVVQEYGLSPRAAEKTQFVGYLGRESGRVARHKVRANLDMQTDRLVVVTAGGGGDGTAMLNALLRDLQGEQHPPFDCLIIGGPLQSQADRGLIQQQLRDRRNLHFLEFTDDLASYLSAADVVVSMGGYNSVCEILAARKPALIVPRTTPRLEQLIRAEILTSRGLLQMVNPRQLTPGRMLARISALLDETPRKRQVLSMNGLPSMVSALDELMQSVPRHQEAGSSRRRAASRLAVSA